MSGYFDPYGEMMSNYTSHSFHSTYKDIILKLDSSDNMEVLQAITTLSQQLSMAQEETLSHIPVDSLINPLVKCLSNE